MRSLPVKILGLCLLVLLTSLFAHDKIRLLTIGMDAPHRDAFATLLTVEMNEARHAYEAGGKSALSETLTRLKQTAGSSEALFTDANGIDLVTGRNRYDLVRRAQNRSRFDYSGGASESFARISPDHRYWYFQHGARTPDPLQEGEYWLSAIGIAAVLCCALSWRLALPLLRLRDAMQRYGDGDLSARAIPRRRDDFGDLARVFNKMADRIQTLMNAEKRLLLDVSHELRSPLTRLQVAIEIACSQGSDRLLDQIQEESERLDDLIGQLLALTRAEGKFVQDKAEMVRVDLLAARIADSCEIESQARGCTLELNVGTMINVRGTSELMHRTIENVLRNAIRFAPAGSTVEIDVGAMGGEIRIVVRDYGPGVPEDSLGRLFDPFYRNSAGGDADHGLGLGLAIARRAVELHHGTIEASNAHPGLRVIITLPSAVESTLDQGVIAQTSDETDARSRSRKQVAD